MTDRDVAKVSVLIKRINGFILSLTGNAKDDANAFLPELVNERLTAIEFGHEKSFLD